MVRIRALLFFLALLVVTPVWAASEIAPELLGEPIEAVTFVADAPIDEAGLRRLLPLVEGRPLRRVDIERAYELLLLEDIFWFSDITAAREQRGVRVTIRLDRKQIVNSVRIEGADSLYASEARRLVRISPGMVFDPRSIDALVERLERKYGEVGFPDMQVYVTVESGIGEVDLRIDVTEGTPQVPHHVIVEGAPPDFADEADDAVKKLRGKRFRRPRLRDAERGMRAALRKAGYYEGRASVLWEGTPQDGLIRVTVNAGPHFELSVSGNESVSDSKLLGLVDVSERLIVTDGTWRELARRMQRYYRELGYYRAKTSVQVVDGDPKKVSFTVTEGVKLEVSEIGFRGVAGVPEERLREEIVTEPPSWWGISWIPFSRTGAFVDELFDDDLRRLWFLYRERGFESAEIVDAPRKFDEEDGTVSATIVVEEGPKTMVRSVTYPQVPGLRPEILGLRLRPGKSLGPNRIDYDQRQIARELGRLGYADVKVESSIQRAPRDEATIDADVTFTATYGERRTVDQVIVQGNIDALDRAVLRELPFHGGGPGPAECREPATDEAAEPVCEIVSPETLLAAQINVYRVGLFRNVSVRPEGTVRDGRQDVVVSVSERPPGRIEWGGGYNTRDGLSTFAEVSYDNLSGMARRIGMRGQVSVSPPDFLPDQYLFHLFYREPRLFDSPWRFSPSVLGERVTRTFDHYSVERANLQIDADRPFTANLRGGVQLQTEYSDVFDVEDDIEVSSLDQSILHTIAVAPFVVLDTRDNTTAPRNGTFDSARVRWSMPELSSVHFVSVSVEHVQYLPMPWHMTFLYLARAGWGTTLDHNEFLPIRERFFLGGRDSVRGFEENSIGPEGTSGHAVGGDLAVSMTTELRVPIYGDLQGAIFADGGGVYFWRKDPEIVNVDSDGDEEIGPNPRGLSIHEFRRSVGPGLRYLTPVGPISLDYGFKLDRRNGEGVGALHFSIGATF